MQLNSPWNRAFGGMKAQVGYLFASNVLDRALGLCGAVLIARHLGAVELGLIGPALIAGALVARLSDFGVSILLQRDVARRPRRAQASLAHAMGLRALSTGPALAAVAAYAVATQGLTVRAWLPLLGALAALVSGWFQLFAAVWVACLRAQYVVLAQAVYRAVYLALIVAAIAAGRRSVTMMVALLIASVCQLLVGVRITRRQFFVPAIRLRLGSCLRLLRESWPIGVSAFMVLAYDRVDVLVASWFLAAAQVGNYYAAYALYSGTFVVSAAITSVAFSAFSRHVREPAVVLRQYTRTAAGTAALGGLFGIGFGLFASPLVAWVYGARYDSADTCLRILAFAIAFVFANGVAGVTLNAIGRQRITMMLTLGGATFNLAINLLAVPTFGIVAAAWATVATEAAMAVAAVVAVQTALRRALPGSRPASSDEAEISEPPEALAI